jgi:hypothetical protein
MTLRNRFRQRTIQRSFGLLALVFGTILKLFLHPTAFLTPGLFGAIVGFFYGIAIAALLLSLKRDPSGCVTQQS